ncbi:hypothetical protein H0H93_009679 [Arthromyces matolae]|nr:hypothetical protein H0H93_009679 [Arthromyces matolae]
MVGNSSDHSHIAIASNTLSLIATPTYNPSPPTSTANPHPSIHYASGAIHALSQITVTASDSYTLSGEFSAPTQVDGKNYKVPFEVGNDYERLQAVNSWPPETDIGEWKGTANNWFNTFNTSSIVRSDLVSWPTDLSFHALKAVLTAESDGSDVKIDFYVDNVLKATQWGQGFVGQPLWLYTTSISPAHRMAHDNPPDQDPVVFDEDAPGPPISVPDSGDTGEGGRLKMIIQLVKKCFGVKDIASMRLSLPASLMEPMPNLEYWHYLDRPDIINDSDDPFERMLAVLRFTLTKDLKVIHGKVCKPYNSVLGEHFRSHWDVVPATTPYSSEPSQPVTPRASSTYDTTASETFSLKSEKSSRSNFSGISLKSKTQKSPSTAATSPQQPTGLDGVNAGMSNLSLANGGEEPVRVVFLTEQVSHHPPVSAFYASCPERHLDLMGIDQIAAKVSGMAIRVAPGELNKGLFLNITGGPGEGEKYHITHPIAAVNGILRGSFYVTIGDSTIITCEGGRPGQKFRTIIEYKEEASRLLRLSSYSGVIYTVHEGETECEEWTKVKHVPHSRVVAVFDGSWRGHVRWRRVGLGSYPRITSSAASSPSPSHETLPLGTLTSPSASKASLGRLHDDEYCTLIDLSVLQVLPMTVRPLENQLPRESRKMWASVTDHLLKKEYSDATREKIAIEQRQRDEAAERKRKGSVFMPQYFEKSMDKGYSELTEEGRAAVEEELKNRHASLSKGSKDV